MSDDANDSEAITIRIPYKTFWASKTFWVGMAQIVYGAASCFGAAMGTWGTYQDAQWIASGCAMLGLRIFTKSPIAARSEPK